MARVFWDGQRIVATACKANYQRLVSLAEKYKAEPLPPVNGYSFIRTKESILDISTLEQTVFDDSFEKLLNAVNKSNQNHQEEINKLNLPDCMYPYQKEAVAQIVKWNHNALLASEMGLGKSLMATISLSKLPDAYPALVICPASLKVNWETEIHKWTPDVRTYIIEGRESYHSSYVITKCKEADVLIINYDILGVDDKEAQEREKKRIQAAKKEKKPYRKAFIPVSGWVDILIKEIGIKAIVCDECQYIESDKAVRTRAVIQLSANKRIIKLFLSGTPFETKVSQFYTTCHIIAPDLFPKEFDFKQRYCNPVLRVFGKNKRFWEYNGVSNLDELRRKLSTFMIRQTKAQYLKQLPPKIKTPIYFDMDDKARKLYDQMEDELMIQKEGMHQFAYLAKMKEALMEIKIEPTIQFIKDMLEIEDKLVIFTYHTSIFDTILNEFGGIAVGVNGDVSNFKRQEMVNKFQNNADVRLFVGQIQAASTGITLTASHTVIFTEWGQTAAQMSQAEDRIHRIGQDADRCNIYYLIAKDTVDEGPLESLTKHYQDIQAVLNGDTSVKFVDIDDSMIAKVKSRLLLRNKETVRIEYD